MRGRKKIASVLIAGVMLVPCASARSTQPTDLGYEYERTINLDDGNFPVNIGTGLSLDQSANLYVIDSVSTGSNDSAVVVVNANSGLETSLWGPPGSDPGQFESPTDIAVAPTGDVYVTDTGNGRIQRFDSNGTFKGMWPSPGQHIAVGTTGDLYVSDSTSNQVQVLDANGNLLRQFSTPGAPGGLAIGPTGNVDVAGGTSSSSLLQVFDPLGSLLLERKVGRNSTDVAVDSGGNIFVNRLNKTQVYGPSGSYLTDFGAGLHNNAQSIVVDAEGTAYVLDCACVGNIYGSRITVWRPDDSAPTLSIRDSGHSETDKNRRMGFFVSLSRPSGHAVKVRYKTRGGTAKSPSDFTATKGTLRIPAGANFGKVFVPTVGDDLKEADEKYVVKLSRPVGATLAKRATRGIIYNDD